MSVRVKCNNIGCEKCTKGRFYSKGPLGDSIYYCKSIKSRIIRRKAENCSNFRCKCQYEYFCKTCRGGR